MKKIGMMSALLAGGAAFAADGIKMGGFVDAGFNWHKQGDATGTGFALNDGAIYLGKTMGMGEVMIDMPFGIFQNDLLAADSPLQILGSNFIIAGWTKAQAWVSWKYDNGFNWKLGQFDYVLGLEASDSADRVMASKGIVFDMFKYTHMGTTLGYDLSDSMGFKILFANSANDGIRSNTEIQYDMGLTFNMNSDAFRFNAGYIMSEGSAFIFDINAGTKAGPADLDFEVALKKASANAEMEMGFLVHANIELGESMGLGVRGEYKKLDALTTLAFAAGPHFQMSKDMTVRLDFDYRKVNTTGADPSMGLMVSAVHKF